MKGSKLELLSGMSGIVFVIALVCAFTIAGPRLPTTASGQAVVRYYLQNHGPLQVAQSLRILAALVFCVFLAGLYAMLQQPDAESGARAAAVLAAGVAIPLLTLVVVAARLALILHAGQIRDAGVVQLVRDFAQGLETATGYPLAVVVGLGSWTLVGTRGAGHWIGLAGGAVAILVVASLVGSLIWPPLAGFGMIGLPAFLAWILAVSGVMTIRGVRHPDRMSVPAIAR